MSGRPRSPGTTGAGDAVTPRFGYLVPEFPAQTHAFFWREIQELESAEAAVDLLSTRPPRGRLRAHTWSDEAAARTTYLGAPRARAALAGLGQLGRALGRGRLRPALAALRGGPESRHEKTLVLLAAAVLAGRARRAGWRHVHVHSCGSSALIAHVAAALSGITYSLTLHGALDDYGPRQEQKWSAAAFALIITEHLLAQTRDVLGANRPALVARAPMGVRLADMARTTPYAPWSGAGALRIFSCGRLNPAKGHDTLIRACHALAARGVPVELTIAGEDDHGGIGYRHELEAAIRELGMAEAVSLIGAVSEDRVRDELRRAHVFALASRGEPLGVAIMEAMAMEVPVVVGDGGGVRELVAHGETGVLVPPGDVEALAAAIGELAGASGTARSLGQSGRRRVAASFSSESSARVLRDAVAHVSRGAH